MGFDAQLVALIFNGSAWKWVKEGKDMSFYASPGSQPTPGGALTVMEE
jgi:hypothetical protein